MRKVKNVSILKVGWLIDKERSSYHHGNNGRMHAHRQGHELILQVFDRTDGQTGVFARIARPGSGNRRTGEGRFSELVPNADRLSCDRRGATTMTVWYKFDNRGATVIMMPYSFQNRGATTVFQ